MKPKLLRLTGIPMLAAFGLAGCSSMENLYVREVRAELAGDPPGGQQDAFFSAEATAHLPEPVRRYLSVCGFMGKRLPKNAKVIWSGFQLKRAPGKPWMPLECRQFNSVREPMRIAYMKGRVMKILPFEGRDKYQNGHGHMLVKAMGMFKVVDEKSRKMDESGLVTVLAEALLVPSFVMRPYIRWEAIDSSRAKAVLEWNGAKVEGVFHFSPNGECIRFESLNRWQQGNDSVPIPWSGYPSEYVERDGIRFPSMMRAVWHERTGDLEYARGRIERIEFDVTQP